MAESKYGKYFITDVRRNLDLSSHRTGPVEPAGSRSVPTPVMWLDNKIVPGAFYVESVWVWPECASERNVALAHTHPFDEVVTFFGTNFDDPTDLCGGDRVLARTREIRDDQELPCLRAGRNEALSPHSAEGGQADHPLQHGAGRPLQR